MSTFCDPNTQNVSVKFAREQENLLWNIDNNWSKYGMQKGVDLLDKEKWQEHLAAVTDSEANRDKKGRVATAYLAFLRSLKHLKVYDPESNKKIKTHAMKTDEVRRSHSYGSPFIPPHY